MRFPPCALPFSCGQPVPLRSKSLGVTGIPCTSPQAQGAGAVLLPPCAYSRGDLSPEPFLTIPPKAVLPTHLLCLLNCSCCVCYYLYLECKLPLGQEAYVLLPTVCILNALNSAWRDIEWTLDDCFVLGGFQGPWGVAQGRRQSHGLTQHPDMLART